MLAFTACGSERKSDEGSTEVLAGQSDNTATNEKADIKTDAKADTANEELEKAINKKDRDVENWIFESYLNDRELNIWNYMNSTK